MASVSRLEQTYHDTVIPALQSRFGYSNRMQLPKISKVVINMGIGESTTDSKKAQHAADDLTLIAGQRAVVTRAKRSIAGFKVRENMPIGAKVTLRGKRMYEFLDRLVTVALPRVRDFRGLNPNSFDGHGNFAMGLREHIVFPEIDYDKVDQIWGMDIIICTTADTDDEARELLRNFNFPFPSEAAMAEAKARAEAEAAAAAKAAAEASAAAKAEAESKAGGGGESSASASPSKDAGTADKTDDKSDEQADEQESDKQEEQTEQTEQSEQADDSEGSKTDG